MMNLLDKQLATEWLKGFKACLNDSEMRTAIFFSVSAQDSKNENIQPRNLIAKNELFACVVTFEGINNSSSLFYIALNFITLALVLRGKINTLTNKNEASPPMNDEPHRRIMTF